MVRAVRRRNEGILSAAHGIEAERAEEVAEVDLESRDDRPHLILKRRGVDDRVGLADHEGFGGHAQPSREAADVGVRRAALDADQDPVRGLVEIDEDHAALLEHLIRNGLEPAVQVAVRVTTLQHADLTRTEAAALREPAQRAFRRAALRYVGQIDRRHAVVEEEAAESRDRAGEAAEVGGLCGPQHGSGLRAGGAGTVAARGGCNECGGSGDANGGRWTAHGR